MQKILLLALALIASAAGAQTTPVGLWQTIDDVSNQPKAEIRISESKGVLTGHIVRSLLASEQGAGLCSQCSDDRKDKPMAGLELIRGMKSAAADGTWQGGNILDPNNGKTYTLRLQMLEGGKKLLVRGYIGPFFRTQIWHRVP